MKIQIRFNTEKAKAADSELPAWRVLADGVEHLAHDVRIEVPSWTTMDEIATSLVKWHITCEGVLSMSDDHIARISAPVAVQ